MKIKKSLVLAISIFANSGYCMQQKKLNVTDKLFLGINLEDKDLVKKAIDSGADVNSIDEDDEGQTPLICAVRYRAVCYRNELIVNILLDHNADPNIKDHNNRTVLFYVFGKEHVNITKSFLKFGADPNAQDNYGNTVLMHCLWGKYFYNNLLKLILNVGVDLTILNKNGKNLISLVEENIIMDDDDENKSKVLKILKNYIREQKSVIEKESIKYLPKVLTQIVYDYIYTD